MEKEVGGERKERREGGGEWAEGEGGGKNQKERMG